MDYSDFIHETLRTLKWRQLTKHYKQHLMMSRDTGWGKLARGIGTASDQWFLINTADEVAKLPYWLFLFMVDKHVETHHWGPYIFYNNFENTSEARYLKEMFKYRVLTPTAETKVRSLLQQYKPLIGINEAFVEALIEREGCPNYWEVKQ